MEKMIYLIPFFNCFLLYICREQGQLFYKPFSWFHENIVPRLPRQLTWLPKIIGGCILCTSFWMGFFQSQFFHFTIIDLILFSAYNAVTTTILYKLLR